MNLPRTLPEQIKDIWEKGLSQARRLGLSIDPNEFAVKFVDENFSSEV
jgi:hypothetical protein